MLIVGIFFFEAVVQFGDKLLDVAYFGLVGVFSFLVGG